MNSVKVNVGDRFEYLGTGIPVQNMAKGSEVVIQRIDGQSIVISQGKTNHRITKKGLLKNFTKKAIVQKLSSSDIVSGVQLVATIDVHSHELKRGDRVTYIACDKNVNWVCSHTDHQVRGYSYELFLNAFDLCPIEKRDELKQSLLSVEKSFNELLQSGFNERAIVTLLHESTRVSKTDIKSVLEGVKNLRKDFTT